MSTSRFPVGDNRQWEDYRTPAPEALCEEYVPYHVDDLSDLETIDDTRMQPGTWVLVRRANWRWFRQRGEWYRLVLSWMGDNPGVNPPEWLNVNPFAFGVNLRSGRGWWLPTRTPGPRTFGEVWDRWMRSL